MDFGLPKNYNLMSYQSVAKQLNNRVYTNYFYRLMLISKSLFKWNNLPNGINEKWIEKYLFTEGNCVFYKDKKFGFMVTKFAANGKLNFYDEPTLLKPYATDYFDPPQLENNVDCVIIRNNDDSIPTFPTIQLYSALLTNIQRTIDTNIEAQKMPQIVKCTDKQRLSLKQAMKQKADNEPVIYADKSIDDAKIEVLKTDAPIVFPQLQTQKMNVWNECMTYLGINNANTDKKERLISNEVDANDQLIKANEDVMLKARQQACKEINEMFGLNISVERRTDLKIDFKRNFDDIRKEGAEDDSSDPT